MKKMKLFTIFGACALALLASVSADESNLSGKTISDWNFPKALSGDEPSEENLKGRVVVLEYWGVR